MIGIDRLVPLPTASPINKRQAPRNRNWWHAIALATLLAFAGPRATVAQENPHDMGAVEGLVCKHYQHGIPYAAASSLGPGAMPALRRVLLDPTKKSCWENAIAVIAAIGSAESFGLLRSFVWDRFQGPVDVQTYGALQAAVATIGLASPGQPTLVVDYLEKGADPKYWSRLPWYYEGAGRAKTERAFGFYSIHGLGYCSHPKARAVLLRLRDHPYHDDQKATIGSSLATQEQVARLGLRAYQESKKPK